METQQNHQAAAEVLAAAVLDLFPNALLLGGRGTRCCFFYDFRFSFTPDKQALALIEERMRQLLKAGTQLEKREMVAANAAECFRAKGQTFLARKLKALHKTVVPICAIGEHFIDYAPFPLSSPPTQVAITAAHALPLLEGQSLRLIGGPAANKRELTGLTAPVEQKLFLPLGGGEWLWLPEAESTREHLMSWWRKEVEKRSFKIVSSHSVDEASLLRHHQVCFLNAGCTRVAQLCTLSMPDYVDARNGLVEPARAWTDRLSLFGTGEDFLERCISSLLFIMEIPKILGFEFYVFFGSSTAKRSKDTLGKEQQMRTALEKLGLSYSVEKEYRADRALWIEIKFYDRLGRLWSGPFIAVPAAPNIDGVLVCSALGAVERCFALGIERHGKNTCEWMKREVGSEPEDK
jgi:hypothetical protein